MAGDQKPSFIDSALSLTRTVFFIPVAISSAFLLAALNMLPYTPEAEAAPGCSMPTHLQRFKFPLLHLAERVQKAPDNGVKEKITFLATGTSSTDGVGASSQDKAYPPLAEIEFSRLLPDHEISVIKKAYSGKLTHEVVEHLEENLKHIKPDVIFFQAAMNDMLSGLTFEDIRKDFDKAHELARATGADFIIINIQNAPPSHKEAGKRMSEAITAYGEEKHIAVYERGVLMEDWERNGKKVTSPDLIHATNEGHECFAKTVVRTTFNTLPVAKSKVAALGQGDN